MTSSVWQPEVNITDTKLREELASIADAQYGAGLVGFDPLLDYSDNTVGKQLKTLGQDISQSLLDGYASITSYGAVGDGVTDDSAAIAAALAANLRVYFPVPAVAWRVETPIVVSRSNAKLLGANRALSKISAASGSLPVISVNSSLNNVEINNICLDRLTPASTTGSGIECSGVSSEVVLQNLVITNQWHGLSLGDSERSIVNHVQTANNYGNGINIATGSTGLLGWNINNCKSRYNNGNGVAIVGAGAAPITRLGELDSVVAEYNGGWGLSVIGAANKVLDSLKVIGGTYSLNNAGGIFVDSFGGRNRISGVSAALSGTAACGRQASPMVASGQGDGIQLGANTIDANVSGCVCNENSHSGIAALNLIANIAANACNNNGKNVGASSALRSGIRLNAGQFVVGGNTCTNTSGTQTQVQGIHITGGSNTVINANNVAANINAVGITVVSPAATNRITNNPGYNPQPAEAVAVGTSPWTYTAGNAPETIYWRGGTVSAVAIDGITIQTASAGATFPSTLELGPNESATLTFTVAPTQFTRKRH